MAEAAAPDVSVVVPTYRSSPALGELLDRIRKSLAPLGVSHEVVIVNDASPDDTWATLEALRMDHPELVAIDLMRNQGQPLATLCGLSSARGRIVVTMDDDLQHPPEEIPKLLAALDDHPEWDVAVGSWQRDAGLLRNFGSWLYGTTTRKAYHVPGSLRHTAFRAMHRRVAEGIVRHETRTPVVSSLLVEVTSRIGNVTVEHHERPHGESTFTWRKSIATLLDDFFQGSTLPLQLLSRFGLVMSLFSLLLAAVFFVRWAIGVDTPPGWASSFLTTVFFGGAILFGMGLQGRYLQLMIREVKRPPRWVVRNVLAESEGSKPAPPRRFEDPTSSPPGDG